MAAKPVRNLVVVSDLHAGCALGLCPAEGVRLDDGGRYTPSKIQKKVWGLWQEFWDEWVPEVTRGEPYDFVCNGDVLDGSHHGSTTQISQNIKDQILIAEQILKPVVDKVHKMGGRYMHLRGTEAHIGKSGAWEELVAKDLGAVPNDDGQYARYDLWLRVGKDTRRVKAPLVHLLHHVGTTGSAAHEASAVNAELVAEYAEAARSGQEIPDYVIRSHRHRSIAVDLNSYKGYAAAIVTPAWQLRTPFAFKIPGARIQEPQFGGVMIRQGSEEHYYRRKVWSLLRSPEI